MAHLKLVSPCSGGNAVRSASDFVPVNGWPDRHRQLQMIESGSVLLGYFAVVFYTKLTWACLVEYGRVRIF